MAEHRCANVQTPDGQLPPKGARLPGKAHADSPASAYECFQSTKIQGIELGVPITPPARANQAAQGSYRFSLSPRPEHAVPYPVNLPKPST